jgi:hypothetical protein
VEIFAQINISFLFLLLRYFQIFKLYKFLRDYFNFLEKQFAITTIIQLFLMILLMAHFWSCGFLSLALNSVNKENWIEHAGLEN